MPHSPSCWLDPTARQVGPCGAAAITRQWRVMGDADGCQVSSCGAAAVTRRPSQVDVGLTLTSISLTNWLSIKFNIPASMTTCDTSTPGRTCITGGGLDPAPTTSSSVNSVHQSYAAWMLAALVFSRSCRPYATWRLTECMTSGFIISSIRSEPSTYVNQSYYSRFTRTSDYEKYLQISACTDWSVC